MTRGNGLRAGISMLLVVGAIAGGALVSGVIPSGGGPAPTGTANFWVDTSGGTCTRQATAGNYVDAQACGSFNTAFQAATAGDTIRVVAGTYSAQTISNKASLPSNTSFTDNVNIIAASGVNVPGLTVGAEGASSKIHGLNVDGVHVTSGTVIAEGTDIEISNGEYNDMFYIENSDHLLLDHLLIQPQGGVAAPFDGGWGMALVTQARGSSSNISNITLQNSVIRHVRATIGINDPQQRPNDHPDGIFVFTGGGITGTYTNINILNNQLYDNECTNFRWANNLSDGGGFVVQNNFFGPPIVGIANCGTYTADFANSGVNASYNTFEGLLQSTPDNSSKAQVWRSNIGDGMSTTCRTPSTYVRNLWRNQKCTGDLIQGDPGFVGGSTYPDKLFLSSGSIARDAGDSLVFPTADGLGHARPFGSAPDIGAYEFGAS